MAAARKPKAEDPVVAARFARCGAGCGTTLLSCRALDRHRGRPCCTSCTHPRKDPA